MVIAQTKTLFSIMKRVKYYGLAAGTKDKSDLLLLVVLKEGVNEMRMEEVVYEFAKMKIHRDPLLR